MRQPNPSLRRYKDIPQLNFDSTFLSGNIRYKIAPFSPGTVKGIRKLSKNGCQINKPVIYRTWQVLLPFIRIQVPAGKRSRLNSRMATTKVEDQGSSSNLDMKQQEKLNLSDPDVGEPRDDVEQHPPMTIKRIMALFSLACLVASAQIPLYLIGGTLGNDRLRT